MQRASSGIAYRRNGVGPTLVLLHGIPGQGQAWERVAARLTDTFDVVTPDLIGFGSSDGPTKPTIDEVGPTSQAEAVAVLLDELRARDATVVGHDFGAPVGVLLAEMRPERIRALSLLSGNLFPDTPIPFPLSLVNAPAVGGLLSQLLFSAPSLGFMLRRGTGAGSAPPDTTIYLGDRRQRQTIATIFRSALTCLEELYSPVAVAVENLQIPVHVGWGDQDPFFPLEHAERTATATGAGLRIFHGAGHFLPHERPVELASEIGAFAKAVRQ